MEEITDSQTNGLELERHELKEARLEEPFFDSDEERKHKKTKKIKQKCLDEEEEFVKKNKLRTSKDVFDRLKWDPTSVPNIDVPSVYIGYKDRFLGICELPLSEFNPETGDIPFHRVYYFRTGGAPVDPFIGEKGEIKVREDNWPEGALLIWDRDTRTDLVFNSGETLVK